MTDVISGYETMVDHAEPEARPTVQQLLDLYRAHASEIFEFLERMAGWPGDAGSMTGAVHVAVASARDWFDGLDCSAFPGILAGEDLLIERYGDAIGHLGDQQDVVRLLETQRQRLRTKVAALRT